MTTMTVDLAGFLLARIEEDEAEARVYLGAPPEYSELIGPARVLAECEAKRAIIELHKIESKTTGWAYPYKEPSLEREYACVVCDENDGRLYCSARLGCPTLRLLAAVYADHPDYRKEWKP